MTADSRPGSETAVTMNAPARLTAETDRKALKVLAVDDDPDFLAQYRITLSGLGFEVVTAGGSEEALRVADREAPEAFVLDLMMERPDSGAQLARALRRDPRFRRAPIIILTSVVRDVGFDFYRNPQEVLNWMKADAWFDKPPPAAELGSTLRRLLAAQQAAGEAKRE